LGSKRTALIFFFFLLFEAGYGQKIDTVLLRKTKLLVLKDSIFIPNKDTLLLIPDTVKYSIKTNQYAKTQLFYDSAFTGSLVLNTSSGAGSEMSKEYNSL
jgi:hypothetical protein